MEEDVVRHGVVKKIWALDGMIHMLIETKKGLDPMSGDHPAVARSFLNAFGNQVFINGILNTSAIVGQEIEYGVCDEHQLAFIDKPLVLPTKKAS